MASEILTPMKLYLQSGNGLESLSGMTDGLTQAVASALRRYGQDVPRIAQAVMTGDGESIYDLSAQVATWEEGASSIVRVDYPWVVGEDTQLRFDEWEVIDNPGIGESLHLIHHDPASTEYIRIRFSVAWTEATVPAKHIDAVAKLAAAGACRMMAARTLQAGESTYSVDRFHAPTASQNWLTLAKMYEGQYEEAIGLGSDGDLGSGGGGSGGSSTRAACCVFPVDVGDKLIEVESD